jgi:hypothetical protein
MERLTIRAAALLFLGLLNVPQDASAQAASNSQWQQVSPTDSVTLWISKQTAKQVKYPVLSGISTETKTYTEVWVKATDVTGLPIWQALWTYDCVGQVAVLAQADLVKGGRSDVTSEASRVGLRQYMRRVQPDSFEELAQAITCKK